MYATATAITVMTLLLLPRMAAGERDYTCFQTSHPYTPELDIGSDMAIVYGVNDTFADRVAGWREQGYAVGMMTGISWGNYDDYYMTDDGFKKEEVQTSKSGRLYMHGSSETVGYNVPTPAYVHYIKDKVSQAVDVGVRAVFLEEPEYWADTGWSEAFKGEWERHYGEPWIAPDTNVDAQYRASKLKYNLYYEALREVKEHLKARAADQGRSIESHVPTHSLINYAHWRIVSPMSSLMELAAMDGYIAQVWTGTSRTPNIYQGVRKERTFETAFLEYGQMLSMVRPTGRKVWFLADPIEDNPNYSWNNYKWNYECTVIASLMWPEVSHYEVMPWPNRIFRGTYPTVDMDTASGEREGIPSEYATQILAVINALNHMKQDDVSTMFGTEGIGVVVSDSMMFQRAAPHPSDADLGAFYGLSLPLVKAGVPVEPAQLETIVTPGAFDRYRLLVLTYEGQKPLRPEYHDALAAWVRQGGLLLFVDDGSDPYNAVMEWWNNDGANDALPAHDLFERLDIDGEKTNVPQPVGDGFVKVMPYSPSELQQHEAGARKIREAAKEMLALADIAFETQQYLGVQRGPYVAVSVLDESVSDAPLTLEGNYVDIFDPMLPVVNKRRLAENERTLLYDIDWAKQQGMTAGVLAAATRIRDEQIDNDELHFTMRGPVNTVGRARVMLPGAPVAIRTEPDIEVEQCWDASSGTLWMAFPNTAETIAVTIAFGTEES